MQEVSVYYLEGIKDARRMFDRIGIDDAAIILDHLNSTIKGFDASSPVGQMLRGERDFWINQIKRCKE